jgi:citrate synthase
MSTAGGKVIPGLERVLAFESSIAYIDGAAPELSVRGYAIEDVVAKMGYDEMAFLLWHERPPMAYELAAFRSDLASLRAVPGPVLDMLRATPPSAHPMAALRTAVSTLGHRDSDADDVSRKDNLRKAMSLTAMIPTIVAAQVRIAGGQEPIAPDPSLGHAANYYYMIAGSPPDETMRRTLDATLVLYAEHETNASTFAARVVVSTLSDFYSAVVAGIGAIKGPLHGGAIEGAMEMFLKVGSPEKAAAYVDGELAARRLLPGFGHRVYRAGDPRAGALREMARDLGKAMGDELWFDIAEACEKRMRDTKGIIPNVDYFAAIVLHQLGIPLSLMTNVVASARIAGWSAHILEQYANNRLIRPRARYVGQRGLTLSGD